MPTPLLDSLCNDAPIKDWRSFCRQAHDAVGQKRKYTGEPYWTHTESVAERFLVHPLSRRDHPTGNWIGAMILLGHDLIEDVAPANIPDFSYEKIQEKLKNLTAPYSHDLVFDGILDLTDTFTSDKFPNLNRATRKNLEAGRLSTLPEFHQNLKIFDLIDNSSSILQHDPKFAETYFKEKRLILQVMTKADPDLLCVARMSLL